MQRPDRFFSHAVIEARSVRWLPIFCQSGILLDLSHAGFKVEIMGTIKHKPGDRFWLHLPLAGFGIRDLNNLDLRSEVKWVDAEQCRMGGIFTDLDSSTKELIERILGNLSNQPKSKL